MVGYHRRTAESESHSSGSVTSSGSINVIGHTDDRPVKTSRFPSNWELSLARAGRVARFLIDDTQLPATQFSVSGYSSFRPVQPNTSDENRKTNRRVEIVLSKELPQVEAASPANLQ